MRLCWFLILVLLAVPGLGQHKKKPAADAGGGKLEIILPVPKSISPGGPARDVAKQSLQLVTRNEAGYWYSMTAGAVREANIVRFAVAFVPYDLRAERLRFFGKYWNHDKVKADAYLTYAGTLHSVEMLCASGQYRFTPVSIDVNPDGILNVDELSNDWTEWRTTMGTPWDTVRARVCRVR